MNSAPQSVLAYKREVHVDTSPADNELDAFQLWTRFFLCPIVMPCLCCAIFCFHSDEPVVPVDSDQDGDNPPSSQALFFHRHCPCLFELDDSQGLLGDDSNLKPRIILARNSRPPPIKKTVFYKLGTLVARTDTFKNNLIGHWDGNLFIEDEIQNSGTTHDDIEHEETPLLQSNKVSIPGGEGKTSPIESAYDSKQQDLVCHSNEDAEGIAMSANIDSQFKVTETIISDGASVNKMSTVQDSDHTIVDEISKSDCLEEFQIVSGQSAVVDRSISSSNTTPPRSLVAVQPLFPEITESNSHVTVQQQQQIHENHPNIDVDSTTSSSISCINRHLSTPATSILTPFDSETVCAVMGPYNLQFLEKMTPQPKLSDATLAPFRNAPTLHSTKMFHIDNRDTYVFNNNSEFDDNDNVSLGGSSVGSMQPRSVISFAGSSSHGFRPEATKGINYIFQAIRSSHFEGSHINSHINTHYNNNNNNNNSNSNNNSALDIVDLEHIPYFEKRASIRSSSQSNDIQTAGAGVGVVGPLVTDNISAQDNDNSLSSRSVGQRRSF